MSYLFIINEGPYGNERTYNALRLARSLQKKSGEAEITLFMVGDGVSCAAAEQKTPEGFYNIGSMIKSILVKKGKAKL